MMNEHRIDMDSAQMEDGFTKKLPGLFVAGLVDRGMKNTVPLTAHNTLLYLTHCCTQRMWNHPLVMALNAHVQNENWAGIPGS